MVRSRRGRTGQKGHALVTALFVLLLVSLAVALVAASMDSAMRGVRHELRSLKLTALTDAAVAEAMARLADSPGFTGQPAHPFGGGTLGSEVTKTGDTTWRIQAWARHGGITRTVRVDVRQTVRGYAISGWRRVDGSEELR